MVSKFQDMLSIQRRNEETSRAGLKWDEEDDIQLTKMVQQNVSIADIAKNLQRTPGSIKTRLIVRAIGKMQKDNVSKYDAAFDVGIEESDITEYLDKKRERESRYIQNKEKKSRIITNNDIYNILHTINTKLDLLSSK